MILGALESDLVIYYPIEVRLSHICKRVIYFQEEEQRQMWMLKLKAACKQTEFGDIYRMGDYVAEGSFGKVYKAYHKESGKMFAVK
jgi:hypothetical protein